MFINSVPILHVIFRQAIFSRACLLSKQDSYTLCTIFMSIWVLPYLGIPNNLWIYQAKFFLSQQFKALANFLGCNLIPIAVEAHCFIIAERYHDPLQWIIKNLLTAHPNVWLQLVIYYSNMALSHTVGREWFTSSILAFGAQPRVPIGSYEKMQQTVTSVMDLMNTARR